MVGLCNALSIVEEIIRVQGRALAEPPTAAVKLVAAFLEDDVHHGAAVVAEFSRETVVFDLELLNDFDRRLIVDVGGGSLTLLRRAGQSAIHANLGGGIPLAVRNEVCAGRVGVRSTLSCGLGHTAGEKNQSKETSVGQRDVAHIFVGDVGTQARVARVKQRRLSTDAYRFRKGLGRKGEIERS